MSGPTKAIVLIALAVVVIVSLNIAMWRRMRSGVAEGYAVEAAERDD